MVARIDPSVHEEITRLTALLQREKEEEYQQYREFLQSTGIQQRVNAGYTWYPLMIKETGYGLGDYPFLTAQRTQHHETAHQFQGGRQVRLFQSTDKDNFLNGTLHYVDDNEMKIIFFTDELPDWVHDGKIGVDVLFDERSYREMEKALQTVAGAKNCRLAELANILYGKQAAYFEKDAGYEHETLNASQQDAVKKILSAHDIACVHGPPGTGKTTTLVAALQEIVAQELTTLVCTPSNAAADYITRKLGEKGIRVLRIGNLSRIDDELLSYTVEGLLEKHSRAEELAGYKKRALEYRRVAGKYKRSFGPEERRQRDLLYREARALSQEARLLEDHMINDLLRTSQVIVTTLVGVENKYLEKKTFHTVVIDEAAQALEPAVWIPICRAHRVIMAGDPFQLPPTVKSAEAQKGGLSVTLLEKCIERVPDAVHLLDVQYRMNETIMNFSNGRFYGGKLSADPSVAHRTLDVPSPFDSPVEFVDTAGCGYEEESDPDSQSLFNRGEINILMNHWEQLSAALGEQRPSVAIITPYREQVRKIAESLPSTPEGKPVIPVNTVDAFQGQERDIIYISMVRSNANGNIGFLADYRRMNVAMTRAKKKLIVIGDSATLGYDTFYREFLSYCESHATYESAWSYMKM